MFRIFDRYLVGVFFRAFLICFVSLVGMCIVIDAFANLDEFSERCSGLFGLLATMAEYYSYRVSLFFDRLAGVIATIAAMFTISWIQRTNELTPLLSAGVSVYRVIAPVLVAAVGVNGLAVMNQELVIPAISDRLQMRHDDDGSKVLKVRATYDERGILLGGRGCYRQRQAIRPAYVTLPPAVAGSVTELEATEGRYVPAGVGKPSGGWLLTGLAGVPPEVSSEVLEPVGPKTYFLHTSITFSQVSRRKNWFYFMSTQALVEAVREASGTVKSEMAVLLHSRFTRPLASVTLLFLVLPFVLSGADQGLFRTMGACIVVTVVFQAFSYICQRMGMLELIGPAPAAWLPVLVFGTVAVSLFDMVRT